jgi:hypothetical protein
MNFSEESELNHQQQVTILRSALREEAYQFYQNVIKEKGSSLGETFKLLEESFLDCSSGSSIKTLLQSLSTKFFHTERTALDSFNNAYSDIYRLASQCSVNIVTISRKLTS